MRLRNKSPKGRYFTVTSEGRPFKIWIDGFGEYDLTKLDKKFEGADEILEYSSRKHSAFGTELNAHEYSLLKTSENGKEYDNFDADEIIVAGGGGNSGSAIIGEAVIGEAVIG